MAESITNFLSSFKPLEVDLQADVYTDPLVSNKWSTGIPHITYTKGAVILEMLNSIIGPTLMQRLLREYLRTYQFGYATTDSFLSLLQTVIDKDFLHSNKIKANGLKDVSPVEFVSFRV